MPVCGDQKELTLLVDSESNCLDILLNSTMNHSEHFLTFFVLFKDLVTRMCKTSAEMFPHKKIKQFFQSICSGDLFRQFHRSIRSIPSEDSLLMLIDNLKNQNGLEFFLSYIESIEDVIKFRSAEINILMENASLRQILKEKESLLQSWTGKST